MKIICETKRKIDITTSCRKEYCCKELKKAMESFKRKDHTTMHSNFKINDKTDDIEFETHEGYDSDLEWMKISFCPFCGSPLYVEREVIDNTDKLPKEPPLKNIPKFLSAVNKTNVIIEDEEKTPWWRFWK